MGKRAAIYARQSNTTEGSQSLAIQVDACRRLAERFEVEVIHELVEPPSTSAYKDRGRTRREFNALLRLIKDRDVDCVIIYKTDRMSRGGGVGWSPLLEAIEAAGHNTSRFVLSESGWLSEFKLSIRAAMDREEAFKIATRMTDVRALEARQGRPRPGRARGYGYERDCVSVREPEAVAIREAARRLLSGESLYSVVKDWNARAVPTVAGRGWSSTTLGNIMRSPRIAGLRAHHGEIVATGQWPAIISPAEHHELAALLAPRTDARRKTAPRTFALIGLLFCGRCGAKLRSAVRSGGTRSYACRKGDNLNGCGGIRIKAEWVEDEVRTYVVGALTDPEVRRRIIAALPTPDGDREVLLTEMRQIEAQRRRVTDLAVEGSITPREAKRKNEELDVLSERFQSRLASAPRVRAMAEVPLEYERLAEEWTRRGVDYQRLLSSLTIRRITVNPSTRPSRVWDPDRLRWELRV